MAVAVLLRQRALSSPHAVSLCRNGTYYLGKLDPWALPMVAGRFVCSFGWDPVTCVRWNAKTKRALCRHYRPVVVSVVVSICRLLVASLCYVSCLIG